MKETTIEILFNNEDSNSLYQPFEDHFKDNDDISFFIVRDNNRGGLEDSELLLALISSGGAIISVLIAGIFNYFSKNNTTISLSIEINNKNKIVEVTKNNSTEIVKSLESLVVKSISINKK